jgi:hypothetical protein
MPSEAEMIIAFLFKRSGKKDMKASEFYLTLSMELKWFTPEESRAFLNNAIKERRLIKKEDNIAPAFDYEQIVVPIGFQPSRKSREQKIEKKEDVNLGLDEKIVGRIVEKTNLDEMDVVKRIESTEKEREVSRTIAALLVGKEYDVKLEDLFIELEENLFI